MSAPKLTAGRITRVRISPKNCMAIVDVVKDAGMFVPGMSFAHAASIALGCVLEVMRKNRIVPERDGFEYTAMMAQFPKEEQGNKTQQYALRQTLAPQREGFVYPTEGLTPQGVPTALTPEPAPDYFNHPNIEIRRLFRELSELDARKRADPENFDQSAYDKVEAAFVRLI